MLAFFKLFPSNTTGPESVDMYEVKESLLSLNSLEFAETCAFQNAGNGFWLTKSSRLDISSSDFTVLGLSPVVGIDPCSKYFKDILFFLIVFLK
jgi:hypothetical protein